MSNPTEVGAAPAKDGGCAGCSVLAIAAIAGGLLLLFLAIRFLRFAWRG